MCQVHFYWENKKDVSICRSLDHRLCLVNICWKPEWLQDLNRQNGSPDGRLNIKKRKLAQWKLKFWKTLLLKLPGKELLQAGSEKGKFKTSPASSSGSKGKAVCPLGECVRAEMWKGVEIPTGDIYPLVKRGRIWRLETLLVKKWRAKLKETVSYSGLIPGYTPRVQKCPLYVGLLPYVSMWLE